MSNYLTSINQSDITTNSINHIGIILDGNRRYAKTLGLKSKDGHKKGVDNLEKLIFEWAPDLNIKELTLYTFSVQNFKRSKEEVAYLLHLFNKVLTKFFKDNLSLIKEKGLRINFIGRLNMFPKKLQELMQNLKDITKNNTRTIVNFAMAYGGREEIIDGIKKLVKDLRNKNQEDNNSDNIENLNQEEFSKYLYLKSEPDIIIRTGGDHRTSNFLVWQSWYSEWFFLDKFWPEFEKQDLVNVINSFQSKERRFGQ